jgi:tetrahydromethanopterin S-methyltransferase subunit G
VNQPTEDRIKRIEERLDRIEQQTEPINAKLTPGLSIAEEAILKATMDMVAQHGPAIVRLEAKVDSGFQAIEKRLDAIAEDTKKRFEAIAGMQKMIFDKLSEK